MSERSEQEAVRPRLNLSTASAKADAARALPALFMASAMGSTEASHLAGQILGQTITDAFQPSLNAMQRLAQYRQN